MFHWRPSSASETPPTGPPQNTVFNSPDFHQARETILRPDCRSTRVQFSSVARATFARRSLRLLLIALVISAILPGCAVFRRKGATAEGVATSRELSRQGVAAMEMGQWQQAEDLLRKSLEASTDDASTHRSLAEALWHRGACPEAMTQIELAVEHDPHDANTHVRAGEMALALGARNAAFTHAERAIRSDPKLASAWALRGRCFQRVNQPERALADMNHAVELAPQNADYLLDVATIYRQRGQAARCLTTIHHLLDTYSPGEEPQSALMLQGLVFLDMNRPQQAAEALALAAQRGQPNVEILYHLARAYTATGEAELAATTAQQALALDATHQPTRELLSQIAARSQPDEAQRR